jgi:HlyD family secretion protein
MKKLLAVLLVLAAAGGLWAYARGRAGGGEDAYRVVTVERGDVEQVVSATGALDALTTIEVGTQVSGQIAELYADFNDRVERGQLIARLDATLLEQAVREAEASLARARAERARAEREHRRGERLYEQELISDSDVEALRSDLEIATAAEVSARAGVERAQRNLAYTEITSPIDGVVVERTVDVGQTVAASLSTPRLFLIAEDLSQMEILVAVDESDIGSIEEGQDVRFTVQSYPDDTFTGTVRQVRLQSTTLENVVSYTVVVDVDNESGSLLPGMTATVEFVIGTAEDVLKVPNAALRFRPTEEMVAALRARRDAEGDGAESADGRNAADRPAGEPAAAERRPGGQAVGGAAETLGGDGRAGGLAAAGAGRRPADRALLWTVDADGRPEPLPVRTGISDGQVTEVSGPGLEEGMQIIAGITATAGGGSANPFAPAGGERRWRPGGF